MICPSHISMDQRKHYEVKKKGQGAKVLFRLRFIEACLDLQLLCTGRAVSAHLTKTSSAPSTD